MCQEKCAKRSVFIVGNALLNIFMSIVLKEGFHEKEKVLSVSCVICFYLFYYMFTTGFPQSSE